MKTKEKKIGFLEKLYNQYLLVMSWLTLQLEHGRTLKAYGSDDLIKIVGLLVLGVAIVSVGTIYVLAPFLTIGGGSVGKTQFSNTGASCQNAAAAGITKAQLQSYYSDPTNSYTLKQAAIAANIIVNSTYVYPVAGVATGVAFSNGTIPCNSKVAVWWGDNVNYYVLPSPGTGNPVTVTATNPQFTTQGAEKMSTLTSTIFTSNGITTVQNSQTWVTGTTSGAALGTATFTIKGGAYSYGAAVPGDFGSGTFAISLVFNSITFKQGAWGLSCTAPGRGSYNGRLTTQTVLPNGANVPTNYGSVSYEFPSTLLNYSSSATCTISGQTTSSWNSVMGTDSSIGGNFPLNIYVNDKVLSPQGTSLVPTYLDPQLTTDLGQSATVFPANIFYVD